MRRLHTTALSAIAVLFVAAPAGAGATASEIVENSAQRGAPTSADGEPIKVGAVSSQTGPATFPESDLAAQAVFDRVNAEGGIDGRPIEYIVEDDAFDAATASAAARRLVDQEGVVAMVGSASLLECAVNGAFYAERGVYAVQGTGIDPLCYRSSTIAPVNTGPFFGDAVALFYASEELGAEQVCFGAFDIPDYQAAYDDAIGVWSDATGKELVYRDTSLPLEGDLTPFMLALDGSGCDVAVVQANDFHYVAMMTIKAVHGLDVQIVGLTSGYTDEVADELGDTGDGLILASEFEPYTETDSPVLADWVSLMEEADVPLTSFSQGGYLAATIFVDVLRSIDGDVDRESVGEALRALDAYETELIGNPYSFGDAPAHNPNRSVKFVELQGGEWVVKTPDWITLDEDMLDAD